MRITIYSTETEQTLGSQLECGCALVPLLYLIVPVGEGRGLMRWAIVSGMLMVRGEMCG